MRTLEEIKSLLAQLEETTLLEILDLKSADLVERFEDRIEDNADKLELELEQWFDPEEED